jgi:hypothetical protein
MSSSASTPTTTFDDASKKALLNCPTIELRDGTKHPAIGFGVSY